MYGCTPVIPKVFLPKTSTHVSDTLKNSVYSTWKIQSKCAIMYTPLKLPIKLESFKFNTLQLVYKVSVHSLQYCVQKIKKCAKNVNYSYREVHHSVKQGSQKLYTILTAREKNPNERGTQKSTIISVEKGRFHGRGVPENMHQFCREENIL